MLASANRNRQPPSQLHPLSRMLYTETMRCTKCKKNRPKEMFPWKNKATGERHSHCKVCKRVVSRAHYHKNKHEYDLRNKVRKKQHRDEVNEYKANTPCTDCGVQYPPYVMDFDHRDPEDKIAEIARLVTLGNRQKIWDEIAKCDLVCANCHRERTYAPVV